MTRLLTILGVLALLGGPGMAAEPAAQKQLKKAEQALTLQRQKSEALRRRAEKIETQLEGLRRSSVAAAMLIHDREAEAARLEARLFELAGAERAASKGLFTNRGQYGRVLMALQRMARHPPEALLTQPMSPADTVRSAILLRAVVPEIERRAKALRDDLGALASTQSKIERRRQQLATATQALHSQGARLDNLLAETGALQRRTQRQYDDAKKRAATLAREAGSLRDLMAALAREKQRKQAEAQALAKAKAQAAARKAAKAAGAADDAPAGRTAALDPARPPRRPPAAGEAFAAAKGRLPFPAIGRIVRRYGEPTSEGFTRKGIDVKTRSDALVVAPHGGDVVFAGPFRGYGQLLIIEHGEGYHSLLAGMARVDVTIGQSVLAGEPVAVMGRSEEELVTLYVEFRRRGQPINPLPWLAQRKDSVNG